MLKISIIGGVAGGATAAARLRRLSENAEITIFEKGEHISYANCGLPYYIGSVISQREKLFLQTPASFAKRFNVDVKVFNEVIAIDRKEKTLTIKNIKTNETYKHSYDKLVLSPGAEPIKPSIDGIDSPLIFTLRNIFDTDKIKNFVDNKSPKTAIVIGGGFVGLEMLENLRLRNIVVSVVEAAPQVMAPIDREMAAFVHSEVKKHGCKLYLNDGVKKFISNDEKITAVLSSGKKIEADMAILSIGVKPESKLAIEAGLKVGEKNGIVVNKYLQTTDLDIYAVGDAIEFDNPITKLKTTAYLAGPANRQARLAADNIIRGNIKKYSGAIATSIVKVFDLTVAATGANEKMLEKGTYSCVITVSNSHANYYPGATQMVIKTIFENQTGKVFGAQIVGYDGVDKRIDMIASVIKNSGTVGDLQELEHSYAPPYSSAKDPVNIAGYAAENVLLGDMKVVYPTNIDDILEKEKNFVLLVDVRTNHEFALGTIKNAINIPLDELRKNIAQISHEKEKKIIIFCAVGLRGYLATRILANNGFKNVYNLTGGYKVYNSFSLDKENIENTKNQT